MEQLEREPRRAGEAAPEVKTKDSLDESSDLENMPEGSSPGSPAVEDLSEEVANESPLPDDSEMQETADPDIKAAASMDEWTAEVEKMLQSSRSFGDLGEEVLKLISSAPTPLGRFFRQWCLSAQPHHGTVPPHSRRGDILPMPIWSIGTHVMGITAEVTPWLQAAFTILNFNYCTGWSRPVCVPIESGLSGNQIDALLAAAKIFKTNIISADPVGTLGQTRELLASKKFDYSGSPIEYMQDLEMEKVAPAWPRSSEAGIQDISKYLGEASKEALAKPHDLLLPPDKMPAKAPKSRVRATDQEWYKICKLAHERGLMRVVQDKDIPRDREGHLSTNGAGGVYKEKTINGVKTHCQRFISILCPINACTTPLTGAQDTLPFIGTLTALQLDEEDVMYLESEDLQSAFNLFSMPDQWLPFFAYSKKTDASAFGLPAGSQVRPALCVVPMGWHSAVGLVQEAVRCLVFEKSEVPRVTSVEKGRPLPDTRSKAIVYLDNFDEIHVVKKLSEELRTGEAEMADNHRRFVEVCDQEGLPRNLGKQLIHAFAGGLQGGLLDGENGVLRIAPDKLQNFFRVSLGLLAGRNGMSSTCVTGQAKRPL